MFLIFVLYFAFAASESELISYCTFLHTTITFSPLPMVVAKI